MKKHHKVDFLLLFFANYDVPFEEPYIAAFPSRYEPTLISHEVIIDMAMTFEWVGIFMW